MSLNDTVNIIKRYKMKKQDEYKYSILERLKKLPLDEYKVAKNKLPLALKISKPQFDKYVYAKIGSEINITVEKLTALASFFNCTVENLMNEATPIINYEKLKSLETEIKGSKFNLK